MVVFLFYIFSPTAVISSRLLSHCVRCSSSRYKLSSKAASFSCVKSITTMSVSLQSHAFAGNPIRLKTPKSDDSLSHVSSFESLKLQLFGDTHSPSSPNFKVLPFRKGRPLASSGDRKTDSAPSWHLGWLNLADFKAFSAESKIQLTADSFVYLGSLEENDTVYLAVDISDDESLVPILSSKQLCFVELRTLMVATDWADTQAMGELAIAGHYFEGVSGKSVAGVAWHIKILRALRREDSPHGSWKKEAVLERVMQKAGLSPYRSSQFLLAVFRSKVVIMLVIDKENDRVLLSRQSRFVPRMWSCLAGFIEITEKDLLLYLLGYPGESLEEAVKRETWEETGIEVGEVVYHSSQPWPVGPSTIPCQLMVGFYAYAKSFDINVDKEELDDAQWHGREDVKKALILAEYKKAQRTAAAKVEQMCRGVGKGQSLSADFNVESGELNPMFVPGPFAIAHHLISSWVYKDSINGVENLSKQQSGSMSNL